MAGFFNARLTRLLPAAMEITIALFYLLVLYQVMYCGDVTVLFAFHATSLILIDIYKIKIVLSYIYDCEVYYPHIILKSSIMFGDNVIILGDQSDCNM
jgi:hypothetical protein